MVGKRSDVEVIACDTVFQGYFRIDRYRLKHKKFAGGWSGEMSREVFERGHAVGVLPYDPVRNEIVLIEQFRTGAYAAGWNPWLTECVAGIIEDGEAPADVAKRETMEETGLEVSDLIPVIRMLVSPGANSQSVELFLGRVDATDAGGIHGLDQEHEDIRVFVAPLSNALSMLGDGRISDSHSIVALQWLALHLDEVRERWE